MKNDTILQIIHTNCLNGTTTIVSNKDVTEDVTHLKKERIVWGLKT